MNYCFPGPNFNLISISIKINTTLPDTLALRHRHSVFHEPRGNVAPRHPGCSHILKLFFFGFFSSSIQDFFAHGKGTHRPDLPTALNGTTFSVEVTVTATEAVMDWHQNPSLPHHILCKYQFIRRRRKQPNMNPGSPHNGLLGPGQDHVVWCLTRLQDPHPRPLVVEDHVWERSHQQRSPRARGGGRNGLWSVSSRCLQSCLGVTVHHRSYSSLLLLFTDSRQVRRTPWYLNGC